MSKKEQKKQDKSFRPNMGGPKKPKRPFNFYWIYAIIGLVLISINLFSWGPSLAKITPSEFKSYVQNREVKKVVVINKEYAEIYLAADAIAKPPHDKKVPKPAFGDAPGAGPHYMLTIGASDTFDEDLQRYSEKYDLLYEYQTRESWGRDLIGWLIPLILIFGLWIFIMRRMSGGGGPGGQIFNIGKSKAQLFDQNTAVKVTFDDVAGLDEAKEEVREIVDFLKNPKRYTELGAKIPKGALLVGSPGTGKTLLAKAVAGEAKVPFYSLSGSDFVEMFVGVGASRVRDLFKQAKEKAPSIIFIDEIDAIGRARGRSQMTGANDERENTLNQLLTEMDGFGTNTGVIILAATNRADVLDRALLRPGRFDRQINVDMPDVHGREEIFKVHLKPLKLAENMDIEFLARQTPGFSGADIANICNEAALIAARKNKKHVEKQDFMDAVDRVIAGLEKKSKIITSKEKKTIAYHEAGHATVSWLLEHASPLVKVTIVPRGRSLGAAWYLPEERQITTKEQMLDEICAAFGGRASEEITFGKVSTGALSDLEKITKQVYSMVTVYGLNEKVGNISFYDSTGQQEYNFQKPYSEKTAELIDSEVKVYTDMAYKRTVELLKENKDKLQKVAELLLEREVIYKEDMEEIFGKRPFPDREEELKEAQKANKARRKKEAEEIQKEADAREQEKEEARKKEAEALAKERQDHKAKQEAKAKMNGADTKSSKEENESSKADEGSNKEDSESIN